MYITKDINKLPSGFKQKFKYEPTDTASVSRKRLIELVQRGVITKTDLRIMEFFYKFTISTPELVEKALDIDEKTFKEHANKLIQNRILNRFVLFNEEFEKEAPKDVKTFYCCDMGTPLLLACFKPGEDFDNWRITDTVICESSRVERYLMVIEFYLELKKSCGDRLLMFETRPRLSAGRVKVTPNAVFCVEHAGAKRFFVLEAVREDDLFTVDGNRFGAKLSSLESLLSTDAWHAYYMTDETPVLLLMGDTEKAMQQIGEMAAQSKLEAVRLTSSERIENGLGASKVFAKYDAEKKKFANVKVSIFA